MRPRRSQLHLGPQRVTFAGWLCDGLDARLGASGLARIGYNKHWGRVRVQLQPGDIEPNEALIVELIRLARGLPVVAETDASLGVPN